MTKFRDLLVRVGVDDTDLRKGFRSAASTVRRQGRILQNIGSAITRNLTLPLAAIGTIGGKAFMELEESLTKINTLVGISAKEIAENAVAIRGLSAEVGVSQKALADALFVVQSAGIRDSAKAYEVLERSAKASAIGLGEVKDVARGVTGALQAYSKEGLTAVEATEALAIRRNLPRNCFITDFVGQKPSEPHFVHAHCRTVPSVVR